MLPVRKLRIERNWRQQDVADQVDVALVTTQQFSPQEADQPTSIPQAALTQSHAIKGLGGVGKTQIAVEYA